MCFPGVNVQLLFLGGLYEFFAVKIHLTPSGFSNVSVKCFLRCLFSLFLFGHF